MSSENFNNRNLVINPYMILIAPILGSIIAFISHNLIVLVAMILFSLVIAKLVESKITKISTSQKNDHLDNDQVLSKFIELEKRFTDLQCELYIQKQIVNKIPLNVMMANRDTTITLVNAASKNTLKSIQSLLPIPVDKIEGISYDIFHKNPAVQRKLLANPQNLPHRAQIQVGDKTLDLQMSAIYDMKNEFVGTLLTWSEVSEKLELSKNNNEMSSCMVSIVSAVEQMNVSIQEIAGNANQAAVMTQSTVDESQTLQSLITGLGASSKEIGDIVQVVDSIAKQTNLLALNATIEAARAGESGKGFAVVASEVKALAAQTNEATNDIQKKIKSIQSQTKQALHSIEHNSDSVKSINQVVISMAKAVEEQSAVSHEISENVSRANQIIQLVKVSVDNMNDLHRT